MYLIRAISLLIISLYLSPVYALDKNEEALVEQINQGLNRSLKELKQVVNINSGTMNFPGVKEVGMVFKRQFDEIGFKTQWVSGESFNRSGHLVAAYGNEGPKILMIGHLDTVFSKQDPFQQFKPLSDNKIAGPGITDMKGGDVIMIGALRALKNLGLLDRVQVKVVITGDEERSGKPLKKSKQAIVEAAKWADIALGFEDGDGDIKTGVTSRRGAISWEVNVTGKPAHSSQIFQQQFGHGAIFEAARILNEFRLRLENENNLTFNPGLIIGGTSSEYDAHNAKGEAFGKNNIIAKTAKITGDIRAISPQQLAKAKQVMEEIVTNNLPQTQATIKFNAGYPPMAPTQGNKRLLKIYSQVSQDLGYGKVEAVNPRKAGAADISFAASHVEMALDGMGLMGTGGHTKDEIADMDSFGKNMHKAAILIYRLSNQ